MPISSNSAPAPIATASIFATTMPPMPAMHTTYDAVQSEMQTGDILLFHMADNYGQEIYNITHSLFSHVAMVVQFDDPQVPELLLWNAGPTAEQDYVPLLQATAHLMAVSQYTEPSAEGIATEQAISESDAEQAFAKVVIPPEKLLHSVRLIALKEYLSGIAKECATKNVECGFAYRKLDTVRSSEFVERLKEYMHSVDDAAFSEPKEIIEKYHEGKQGIATTSTTFFCSELIADTYIHLGLLPPSPPRNAYLPVDFSSGNPQLVTLLPPGVALHDEVWFTI